MFLSRLNGERIGFSVLGIFVIDKNTILTVTSIVYGQYLLLENRFVFELATHLMNPSSMNLTWLSSLDPSARPNEPANLQERASSPQLGEGLCMEPCIIAIIQGSMGFGTAVFFHGIQAVSRLRLHNGSLAFQLRRLAKSSL